MNPDQNQDQNPEQNTPPTDQPIDQQDNQSPVNEEPVEQNEQPSDASTTDPVESTPVTPAPPAESISPQPPAPGVAPDPASPADSPTIPPMDAPQEPLLPAQTDPGKTLGIVGFILSFFVTVVGFVLSLIGFLKSKKAGHKNPLALAGIIISIVGTVVWIFSLIALFSLAWNGVSSVADAVQACADQGNVGVVTVDGLTYTCGSISE